MVILQFNKLIRNKWVWGVFAIAISVFFAFDFLIADLGGERSPQDSGAYGTLAGEKVSAKTFQAIAEDVRGFGRQRDWRRNAGEVNRQAWETYAALTVAGQQGIEATDAEVQAVIRRDPSFQANGAFSFALYQRLLRDNGLTAERFEDYLRRNLTLSHLGQGVLASAAWVSPMALDRAVADMTDMLTVRVATFSQDRKAADAVKLDDAALRTWYNDNTNSLALPERVKIRYIKYDATKKDVLAKMKVTEDEMRDRYDVTVDKYTTTDTNGVEKVKKFEEVKAGIEKELRQIAAVQFFETNLGQRVYAKAAAKGASRLDDIAKQDGAKVETSDWFAPDGSYQEGFMKRAQQILPGANGFNEAVSELDATSEDLRYAVVTGEKAVWLIEKAATSPKHIPTFDEAKEIIRPRALRDARAKAFKAEVEAIAKGGAKAVLATKDVTTNLTFVVSDLKGDAFKNQMYVARAAMKLKKGDVSEFVALGGSQGLLVVCTDRVEGDAAKALVMKTQMREQLAMADARALPSAWQKWNLERMGFVPTDESSVEIVETEE